MAGLSRGAGRDRYELIVLLHLRSGEYEPALSPELGSLGLGDASRQLYQLRHWQPKHSSHRVHLLVNKWLGRSEEYRTARGEPSAEVVHHHRCNEGLSEARGQRDKRIVPHSHSGDVELVLANGECRRVWVLPTRNQARVERLRRD